MGAVTPLGIGIDEFWANLIAGKSGVGPITRFDASPFPTRIAAEVKNFDPLILSIARNPGVWIGSPNTRWLRL